MRIGIDACCWSNSRGYGRFTQELLRRMVAGAAGDEFVFFADPWTAADLDLEADNVRLVEVGQGAAPSRAAAASGHRSPGDMLRLTRAVWREAPDVFFSPSVYTYFPLPPRLRAVVAIHDAIAERFPELTLPTRRARLFWNAKVRLALWQARLVLTVSEFSARELATVLKVPPSRIRVTTEAPAAVYRPSESMDEARRAAERVGVPAGARWILYVGGFNPHKHVDLLVAAHGALVAEGAEPPLYLLLVGGVDRDVFHADVARIERAIATAGTADLVRWTGFVPDEELRHLHSGALALALPSACEGFGLPAVEAAACGTPVVATDRSPLPQLLAGGGLFVPPGDVGALVGALRRLRDDEATRRKMGETARRRAGRLSWDESARLAMSVLREAAA